MSGGDLIFEKLFGIAQRQMNMGKTAHLCIPFFSFVYLDVLQGNHSTVLSVVAHKFSKLTSMKAIEIQTYTHTHTRT
jgi:hypothetical protein